MKTITLKLTDVERDIIEKELRTTKPHYKNDITANMTNVGVRAFSHHNKIVTILDVDKFREFLNDEIESIYKEVNDSDFKPNVSFLKLSHLGLERPLKNLKSILSKLEEAK